MSLFRKKIQPGINSQAKSSFNQNPFANFKQSFQNLSSTADASNQEFTQYPEGFVLKIF